MYIKACDFLKIKANPDLIKDIREILDMAEKLMKEMDCVGLCPHVLLENGEDLSKSGRSWEAAKLAMMVDNKMGLKEDETVANVIDSALKISIKTPLIISSQGKIGSKNFFLSEARNLSSVKWKVWLN
ncbi:BnaC09g20140D [Brassica napus]|nr:unnamed protein product [Brassica napus]CDY25973.1 BnaC09g20140D [Brassica napus]